MADEAGRFVGHGGTLVLIRCVSKTATGHNITMRPWVQITTAYVLLNGGWTSLESCAAPDFGDEGACADLAVSNSADHPSICGRRQQ